MVLREVLRTIFAERGQILAMVCFCNLSGATVPPKYIFPRVNYQARMLSDGSPKAIGIANQSRWVNFLHLPWIFQVFL